MGPCYGYIFFFSAAHIHTHIRWYTHRARTGTMAGRRWMGVSVDAFAKTGWHNEIKSLPSRQWWCLEFRHITKSPVRRMWQCPGYHCHIWWWCRNGGWWSNSRPWLSCIQCERHENGIEEGRLEWLAKPRRPYPSLHFHRAHYAMYNDYYYYANANGWMYLSVWNDIYLLNNHIKCHNMNNLLNGFKCFGD